MSNRILIAIACGAMFTLAAMMALTAATGVSQETFEVVLSSTEYSTGLRDHALVLRALFALDSAFLVLYATLIAEVARRYARPGTRMIAGIAIGAIIATALLDMIEDHHILAMVRGAVRGIDASDGRIAFQHALSQTKFHLGYFAEFLVGIVVVRESRVLALLLTAGTLVQGAWLYAAPDAMLPIGNAGRWIGFLVGFAMIIAIVRRAGGASATDVPG
jgi:hypothetical protein